MYIIQRNQHEGGVGFNASPDQIFAAAGLVKTGSFDINGNSVNDESVIPVEEPELEEQPEEEAPLEPIEVVDESKPIDILSILNGKFGDRFKSLDDIESTINELEGKANTDPFANDFVRNLNKALQEGVDPQIYMEVSNIDVDKLNEREAIILQMQWKRGLSKEDAEFLVDRTYKLNNEDGEALDLTDPDVREAQIKLRLDGKEAKSFLSEYKKDALTSPIEKKQIEMNKAWEPVIPNVVDKFKVRSFQTKNGNFDIPTSPTALASAKQLLSDVLNSGMLETMPDKDGLAVAEAIVEKEIMKHDFQYALDFVSDAIKQKQLTEKHNPRKPNPQDKPATVVEDGVINFLKQQRGMR